LLLSPEDAELFFKLHRSLMFFVSQRLNLVPEVASPEEFAALPTESRLEVRNAFLGEVGLLRSFIDENPARLSDDEMKIVLSWQHRVSGRFFVFRQLKRYMVFLSTDDPLTAYGVVALTEPFGDLAGPYLPVMTETVLMPFRDKIIYDGLLSRYNISFGGGIKRRLNDSYRQAKERLGIVTSLPAEAVQLGKRETKRKTRTRKPKPRNPLHGRWRITWMDQWDQGFVDAEVEGFFSFGPNGLGKFQFGYVRGDMDYRETTRDGKPCIEFSWDGNDEMDPAQGRGFAALDGDGLSGTIYIHHGDESGFAAKKQKS
jgi:hypothetical protein